MKILLVGSILTLMLTVGAVCAEENHASGNKSSQGHMDKQTGDGPADNSQQVKAKTLRPEDAARIARNTHKGAKVVDIQHNKNVYIVKIATPGGKWSIYIDDKSGSIVREDREKYHPNPKR